MNLLCKRWNCIYCHWEFSRLLKQFVMMDGRMNSWMNIWMDGSKHNFAWGKSTWTKHDMHRQNSYSIPDPRTPSGVLSQTPKQWFPLKLKVYDPLKCVEVQRWSHGDLGVGFRSQVANLFIFRDLRFRLRKHTHTHTHTRCQVSKHGKKKRPQNNNGGQAMYTLHTQLASLKP